MELSPDFLGCTEHRMRQMRDRNASERFVADCLIAKYGLGRVRGADLARSVIPHLGLDIVLNSTCHNLNLCLQCGYVCARVDARRHPCSPDAPSPWVSEIRTAIRQQRDISIGACWPANFKDRMLAYRTAAASLSKQEIYESLSTVNASGLASLISLGVPPLKIQLYPTYQQGPPAQSIHRLSEHPALSEHGMLVFETPEGLNAYVLAIGLQDNGDNTQEIRGQPVKIYRRDLHNSRMNYQAVYDGMVTHEHGGGGASGIVPHTGTHTHIHARTRTRTHTRAHTLTHTPTCSGRVSTY